MPTPKTKHLLRPKATHRFKVCGCLAWVVWGYAVAVGSSVAGVLSAKNPFASSLNLPRMDTETIVSNMLPPFNFPRCVAGLFMSKKATNLPSLRTEKAAVTPSKAVSLPIIWRSLPAVSTSSTTPARAVSSVCKNLVALAGLSISDTKRALTLKFTLLVCIVVTLRF